MPSSRAPHTVIGERVSLEGKLRFDGVVRIEGRFSGEIESTDTLVVATSAVVIAKVNARRLIVDGTFEGEASVSEEVELRKNAKLSGEVRAARMLIAPGALFKGHYQHHP